MEIQTPHYINEMSLFPARTKSLLNYHQGCHVPVMTTAAIIESHLLCESPSLCTLQSASFTSISRTKEVHWRLARCQYLTTVDGQAAKETLSFLLRGPFLILSSSLHLIGVWVYICPLMYQLIKCITQDKHWPVLRSEISFQKLAPSRDILI